MRERAKRFEDLIVWQKAHKCVLKTYALTKDFLQHELYGLTSQLRRAVVSVAVNIAEGFKKRGEKDKVRFLNIAQGSLDESRYYLILANDLNYGQNTELQTLLEETSKRLEAYSNAIRS